jgi:hypothetical protein
MAISTSRPFPWGEYENSTSSLPSTTSFTSTHPSSPNTVTISRTQFVQPFPSAVNSYSTIPCEMSRDIKAWIVSSFAIVLRLLGLLAELVGEVKGIVRENVNSSTGILPSSLTMMFPNNPPLGPGRVVGHISTLIIV